MSKEQPGSEKQTDEKSMAKTMWDDMAGAAGSYTAAQSGQMYVGSVNKSIENFTDDVNNYFKNSSPDRSLDSMKGFMAEFWHAHTYTIDATARGTGAHADRLGENSKGSVDVQTFDKNGNPITKAGLKYYKTGKKSAKAQGTDWEQAYHEYCAKSENPMSLEEYLKKNGVSKSRQHESIYKGQKRVIPAEQLDDARASIGKLEKKELNNGGGANRKAVGEKYKEVQQNLTNRIADKFGSSLPSTTKETKQMAAEARDGNFDAREHGVTAQTMIKKEYAQKQARDAGAQSALISVTLTVGPDIIGGFQYLMETGELDEEKMKEVGLKALSTGGESYIKGYISNRLTVSYEKGELGNFLDDLTPEARADAINAMTIVAFNTCKNCISVMGGQMEPAKMMDNLVHDCYVAAGGVLGGSALQTMLPMFPFAYHIGSFVGRAVGGIVYKFSPYARLRQRAIDHEYRQRLIESCRAETNMRREYRERLEVCLDAYFAEFESYFDSAMNQMKISFYSGDADGVITAANKITCKLGGRVAYESREEFEAFLKKPEMDII